MYDDVQQPWLAKVWTLDTTAVENVCVVSYHHFSSSVPSGQLQTISKLQDLLSKVDEL